MAERAKEPPRSNNPLFLKKVSNHKISKKMKSNSLRIGLFMIVAGGITLSSCNSVAELNPGLPLNLVSVDNEGSTLIDGTVLKSLNTGTDAITADQAEWLKFMREEEKLARDLYLALSKDYTVPAFKNIARAEQNHMDAVLTVLNSYSLEDPASTEDGVFNNADLQALYNTLLNKGKISLVEALKVGALVEETDILDLAKVIDMNPGDDLTALTEALMLGSRNHLRAFVRVLKVNGVVYVPVALSTEDYTAIVTSDWERGTGFCKGNKNTTANKYCNRSGRGFMRGQ